MIDFGKWAFDNKKLVYFLVAALIVGGIYSYYGMSKLEDPEIKVKQALVVTTYPGASAYQVELEVTDILEKNIRTVDDVMNVTSYSFNDLSLISVELRKTVPDDKVEDEWDLVRRKVINAQASLPAGATTPVVRDDFGNVFGMFYALTGDGLDDRELSEYAELIKREIMGISGIARVDIYGKRSECINVCLDQAKMGNLSVLPLEVLNTLNGQNETIYSGYYNSGNQRIRVSVDDRYRSVEDIGNLIIQGHEDDQLRLKDIAFIEKSYEEPTRNELAFDGESALGISIAAASGTDITKLGKKVEKLLDEIHEDRLPAGVEYHKIFFQPERVNSALNVFLVNLAESVIIVVLLLMFFMGFKSGMIIGICLLVIVMGSFLVLGMMDGSLQRVSLGSFILAMGMLVDNAIVIIDGIQVDLKAGKPRMQALTDVGKKTAMPLLGATVIAIAAFLPIYMSPDTVGVYVHDLFIVLCVSLLLSWVLALIHVPLMANRYFDSKDDGNEKNKDPYGSWAHRVLKSVLGWCFAHRWTTILASIGLLILSALCYPLLPQGFFPDLDYDQLYMEYKLPEGTNSTQVKKDLIEIEKYLKTRKEITHITRTVGGTASRYNLTRSVALPSLSYGELVIDFESSKSLLKNVDEIQNYLTQHYPEAYVKLKKYNLMYKKYPIEVVFTGPDPAVLHQLTDQAMKIMEESEATCLVTTDWDPKVPLLTVQYNQPVARRLGISRTEVGMSLLSAAGGIPVGTFYEGIHPNTIYIKSMESGNKPLELLSDANVFTMMPSLNSIINKENLMKLQSGRLDRQELLEQAMRTLPLKQACKDVKVDWEDPVVIRFNGERTQRAACSPSLGFATEKARQIVAEKIEQIPLPAGYTLSWEGEKGASDECMEYLFENVPLAFILMIAIMIMLFKDYKKVGIIFCCLPFIAVGVIIAMLLSGKTFGIVPIFGCLGLLGMMIKNGIVLMDEISLQLENTDDPIQALIYSSLTRLRPVMMAAMTTVLGVIPLLGDSFFGPMAATIMGGLFFGTFITLILIPVLYALFFKIRKS